MVSSYSSIISSGKNGVIFRLLSIWKGSLHKLMYRDLVGYLMIYYSLRIVYHFILNDVGRQNFENVMSICAKVAKETPLRFILGFFVSGIIGRWMFLYETVPFMDTHAFYIQSLLEGHGDPQFVMETLPTGRKKEVGKAPEIYDPKLSEKVRFHVLRYILLGWIFLMLDISEQINLRFDYQKTSSKPPSLVSLSEYQEEIRSINTERDLEDGIEPPKGELHVSVEDNSRSTHEVSFSEDHAPKVNVEMKQENDRIERVCHSINSDRVVQETFGMLVTSDEMRVLQHLNSKNHLLYRKGCGMEYWVPLQWAVRLVQKSIGQGFFPDPRFIGSLIGKISGLRENMLRYHNNAKMILPLVYTQVVIIAVYTYFLAVLIGSQFKAPISTSNIYRNSTSRVTATSRCGIDLKVPFFEILTFLFFMGWLKVAICVLDPFGSDDEDFEISDQLNFNLRRCYQAVSAKAYPPLLERAKSSYFSLAPSKTDNLKTFLSEYDTIMEREKIEEAAYASKLHLKIKGQPMSRVNQWISRIRYALIKP